MDATQNTLDEVLNNIVLAKASLNAAQLQLTEAVKKLKHLSKTQGNTYQICPPLELDLGDLFRNVLFLESRVHTAIGFTRVGSGIEIAQICDIFAIECEMYSSREEGE